MTGRRYTFHIEDPHDDPDKLVQAIGPIERLGYRIECPRQLAERLRRRQRDDLLRQAIGTMSAPTPWGRCVLLAAEIRRFEGAIWPRLSDRETLPEGYSMLRAYLFRARKLGELPGTARQLRNIIAKRTGAGDFTPGHV